MAKIYNEVVIDMNPESPTFEETLHEDSYEYEGDMMLSQGGSAPEEGTKVMIREERSGSPYSDEGVGKLIYIQYCRHNTS